ncbi:MAG TPA: ATP-binding protein, partial [Anaerolineae bacterium]|nr:ATP-binding protein [Anaerolineae bacterium]
MRKFCSYGPVNTELHYYVPRTALVNRTRNQLVGENPAGGGHYITVWAPRQAGKTWVMQQVLWQLREDDRFDVLKLNLEHLKMARSVSRVVRDIARRITEGVGVADVPVRVLDDFHEVFRRGVLERPLILILDEFDALSPTAIAGIASVLRNIYVQRQDQADRPSEERDYLLHGVALVGVRAVLGIESQTGSPFNVQRSVHIPNLTPTEVREMYNWYAWESGQRVEPEVIERVYHETRGQPGLVSWLGELLTEEFNR